MNDEELDEILDTWSTPEPPASLRERVKAGFAARTDRRRTRGRLALWAAAFGMAAFLVVLTQAFPQTVKLVAPAEKIPYTVESDWTNYASDGLVSRRLHITSYSRGGREIILSQTVPGKPLETFHMQFIGTAYSLWNELVAPLFGRRPPEPNPQGPAVLLASGCTSGYGFPAAGGPVVGREKILDHASVKIQREDPGRRYTVWLAPGLGCFPLRETFERQRPDGSYRMTSERHALKVTLNR
ncbi:MAG TPA: hypothetical protein VLW65_21565 [Bryobacteraceae bacterium]|nr:hypothetical protein [Bryobacteraceae bacterium]